MPCIPIKGPAGTTAIVCTRGTRRSTCSVPGCARYTSKLCDYPVIRDGKPGTCDARLCDKCAVPAGNDRDLCPAHHRLVSKNDGRP
jgi:hypothetical protein